MAAAKEPGIFNAIVAVGTDVDIPHANQFALDFAMEKAVAKNDKQLIRKINELKESPIVESKRFQKRAEILVNLGGIRTGISFNKMAIGSAKNMLFSKYYSVGGLIKGIKGISFCQDALIPEMNSFSLFQKVTALSVPVHFFQGSLDVVTPPLRGQQYFEQLEAANKTFTLFEKSAHMPQYEEPEKFSSLIMSIVKDSTSTSAHK
jgi:pimeloyl-ACP methyl ester carboxylesterase